MSRGSAERLTRHGKLVTIRTDRFPVTVSYNRLRNLRSLLQQALDFRPRRPKLFLDVSVLLRNDAGTGIQRVVRTLWHELSAMDCIGFEVCPVLATQRFRYREVSAGERRITSGAIAMRAPVSPRRGDVFLGLDFAAHIVPKHARTLQAWRKRGVKIGFVVYDLLPHSNPEWFTDIGVKRHRAWLTFVTKHADTLFCISKTVAREVERCIAGSGASRSPDIEVIRLGGNLASRAPAYADGSDGSLPSVLQKKRFVLMVGTIEPRKGHDQALEAFEALWRDTAMPHSQVALVIAGKGGWKTHALQDRIRHHPELGGRLFWFDSASDRMLETLYVAAEGLLIASRGEGFGLPLVEAYDAGLPVLARDLPVFREVGGDSATYFDAASGADLASALANWLAWTETSARPARCDVMRWTWRQSAEELAAMLNGGYPSSDPSAVHRVRSG